MKIIFIAGPFRGDGHKETKEKNVEVARQFVHKFIENNIPFYSPHLNIDQEIASLGREESDLAFDLNTEMLNRCEALAVLPNWEESSGTKSEIAEAQMKAMPIFYLSSDSAIQEIVSYIKE